ncbi:programmed cell death toxin YdcE [Microcystis sp. 0824]|uniref:hypothetical protein n=1 Tax=Microcystis sp. 0824 TaxID=1502726 RepID=UPI000D0BF79D|nr:hypothetical protein [Microcystis sp. 0824]GBF53136.1 programmed cell death toxin YdcE [Microcystis sp. 0824]
MEGTTETQRTQRSIDPIYSVFQSAEVQKLWVLGKRQEAKVKREEKYVYLTSLGNAIS